MTDKTPLDNSAAKTFLAEHTTVTVKDGESTRSMTMGDYYTYMDKSHGIDKKTIKAVDDAERHLISGATALAADDLAAEIKKAKAAGDDPTGLSSMIKVARPNGSLRVGVQAHRTVSNPANPGAKIEQWGAVSVRVRSGTQIDPDAATAASDLIKATMGK